MEADWEVEIGGDAPLIDACWQGFVDLRFRSGDRPEASEQFVRGIRESADLPGLAEVLIRLNGPYSPVWTSKCDVWQVLNSNELDPDELAAPRHEAANAWACYLDLLLHSAPQCCTPAIAVQACKAWCAKLQRLPLTHCRVDLIVRQAAFAQDLGDALTQGITAYLTGCGASSAAAKAALARTVSAFAHTISPDPKVE